MAKSMRKILAAVGVLALLLALVTSVPGTTSAANLTSGQYTYIVDGEEVTFTFDPVSTKAGMLLPIEVFQKFGITVDNPIGKSIVVSKDGTQARLTLGSTLVVMEGRSQSLVTAPLRLNGRIFVPADLLKDFGVEFTQDGNFLVLRSYVGKMPAAQQMADTNWAQLWALRSITNASVKADTGVFLRADFALLSAEMINASNLGITYGMRARLLNMLESNTLVYVKLGNYSNKAGAMVTASTYLIDNNRNQYDVVSVMDLGSGLISNKLAPSADRTGVLVFPKVPANMVNVILYYDNNGSSIGTFNL